MTPDAEPETMTRSSDMPDHVRRRSAFISHLYGLQRKLSSDVPQQVSEARRVLARLRRSVQGAHHQVNAVEVVFPFDPPVSEQDAWLLVAGLFALHQVPRMKSTGPRSLGASLRELSERRNSDADRRRFLQLLSVDRTAVPHYLRQTLRLLSTEKIPVDYHQLLADLVILLDCGRSEADAHRVRLNWARDFYRKSPRHADAPDPGHPETATTSGAIQ